MYHYETRFAVVFALRFREMFLSGLFIIYFSAKEYTVNEAHNVHIIMNNNKLNK